MGQRKALYLRVFAEPHHVFDRAVTPADLGLVLVRGVLRVVNEKVRSIYELGVS